MQPSIKTKIWTPSRVGAFAVLTAFVFATSALAAEGSFDRTLKVTGAVELEVTTGAGSIRVRTGPSGTVRVRGLVKAHGGSEAQDKVSWIEQNPPIEQDGNMISVGSFQNRELQRNLSVSYDLVVPAETQLRGSTGSGEISTEGIRGPLRVTTGSGGLRVNGVGREVEAKAGSGDIQLESIQGAVTARTGSGGIRAAGIGNSFQAITGSGDVQLQQTAPGAVEVETGSGSLDLRGLRGGLRAHTGSGDIKVSGEPADEWSIQTGSGELNLHLPSSAAFTLRAHSSSGQVNLDQDHPLLIQGALRRGEISGTVHGGGPVLDLRTGSGNIRIQ